MSVWTNTLLRGGLALALAKEPELAAPTDLVPVPPRLIDLGGEAPDVDESISANRSVLVQATQLVDAFPSSATAHSRLAAAALLEGEEEVARKAAIESVRLASAQDDSPALISATQVLATLGDVDAAVRAVRELKLEGAAALMYAELLVSQRELDAAADAIEHVDEASAWALRGWIRLEQGDYAAAIHQLRGALARGTPQAGVLANLGYAYAAIGNRAKAYNATLQAMHLAPSNRAIALNLVAYQFAGGDVSSALDNLLSFRRSHPEDVMLDTAVAEARLRLGDVKGALKEIRSASNRLKRLEVSSRKRAEIFANVAFMEWRIGKRSTDTTIETVRKELLRCEFGSLDIGRMLARLLRDLSKLPQLETLYRGLSQVHPTEALYELDSQISFMRGHFGRALSSAKRWAAHEPFDPAAAVDVTYLLAEIERKYEQAAAFGEAALKRVPSSLMLLNNVAFSWALAGNPDRASKLLATAPESPYIDATRGLVKLAQGDIAAGTDDYERAASLAEAAGDEDLGRFIRLRHLIALHQLGIGEDDPRPLLAELEGSTNPIVLVFRRQVRELIKSSID